MSMLKRLVIDLRNTDLSILQVVSTYAHSRMVEGHGLPNCIQCHNEDGCQIVSIVQFVLLADHFFANRSKSARTTISYPSEKEQLPEGYGNRGS